MNSSFSIDGYPTPVHASNIRSGMPLPVVPSRQYELVARERANPWALLPTPNAQKSNRVGAMRRSALAPLLLGLRLRLAAAVSRAVPEIDCRLIVNSPPPGLIADDMV